MPIAYNSAAAAGDPVILFENVGVCYRLPRERIRSIKEYAIRWVQQRLEYVDFWALQNLDLKVYRGEVFGVIGANGAGKSTLLKVIAGVLFPSRGRVRVDGRVAPLLELGAGFHPELTGRENVFLYGTLLGHSQKDIERVFDEIIAFAELDEFIDAPLRAYSTGMTARLGFAVATAYYADILLIDEVLSVGDASFQKKCIQRIHAFQDRGATILFVSHSAANVAEICNRALCLADGCIISLGDTPEVLAEYQSGNAEKDQKSKQSLKGELCIE